MRVIKPSFKDKALYPIFIKLTNKILDCIIDMLDMQRRGGEMADAAASKAVEGNLMRVQLPLSALILIQLSLQRPVNYFLNFVSIAF